MAKVFISHSSKDKAFALELKSRLESGGHVAWLDAYELIVGDSIRAKIDQGIGHCDVVAFVLSPDAIQSRWFNYELRVAQTPEASGRKKLLLPVLLSDCENLPPDLEGIRFADFRRSREQGWVGLEQALARWEQIQQSSSPREPSIKAEKARDSAPSPQASTYNTLEQGLLASAPPKEGAPDPLRKHLEAYSAGSAGGSKKAKETRSSSISTTRVATAVLLILGGLGLSISGKDDSSSSSPPTGASIDSRSTRAVGGDTRSLAELRSQSRVRPLQNNETAFVAERLPTGVFGFVDMAALPLLRQAQVRLTQAANAFEIQKTSYGELLVIGYVRESDFDGVAAGRPISIALAPKATQSRGRLISIPMDRIKAVAAKNEQGERVAKLTLGVAVSL